MDGSPQFRRTLLTIGSIDSENIIILNNIPYRQHVSKINTDLRIEFKYRFKN